MQNTDLETVKVSGLIIAQTFKLAEGSTLKVEHRWVVHQGKEAQSNQLNRNQQDKADGR